MSDELIEWLTANGYANLRELPDGTIIGTYDLLTTRALMVGMDRWGYEHRYCYAQRERATEACAALTTGDDKPIEGYVAERHRTPG